MDDLISRKALLAAYDKAHKGPPGGARKLIEEAPAVDAVRKPAWISCAERLPETEGSYLTRSERGSVYTRHFYTEKECANGYIRTACWSKAGKVAVTHWMPIPE